jgi:2-keto-4-pentenoate hydratase
MDVAGLAEQQLIDYDSHRPGSLFAGCRIPMTVDEAYALQIAVANLRVRRGERIAGHKVGCTSPVMQAQLGIRSPVFGHVFESEIYRSGVVLNLDQFDGLAIEGEFAVRIAVDIANAAWLKMHADNAISAAFVVIELHNYVFRNTPHNAQELIGNNAIHAGAVLPIAEAPQRDISELLDASIEVRRNGEVLGTATGRALPNGPLGSLVTLAEHLERFGLYLRRGDLVLTGSPLPLFRVCDGELIEVCCDRWEFVSARIAKSA